MAADHSVQKISRQKRLFFVSSVVTAVLIIVIVVFATLIAYRAPWMYDMTAGKVFTLSDQTNQVVDELTAPVEIIAIYPTGGADPMISSLLDQYRKAGNQLSVEFVDAEREPAKLAQYNLGTAALSNGTIIMRSGDKSKVLNASDMFQRSSDGNAFTGERQITGAIRYVTSNDRPVVYFLEGHDEASTLENLSQARSALDLDSYETKTLNLVKENGVPQDAALVIAASPRKDLSAEERKLLEDYLSKGGKAMFLLDALSTNSVVLEQFNELLHNFGVDISNNFVIENDPNSHLTNNNLYLIPGYVFHAITQKLADSKRYVVLPIAMGLHTLDFNEDEIRLEPLLASTPKSWMRTDMTIGSGAKTDADTAGPIPLAYAVTKSGAGYGGGDSRLIVLGNSTFINNENLETYANRDFFLNSVGWLVGERTSDAISPRIIGADRLIVRGSDFTKLAAISLFVLPMLPLLGAFAIWYLRRNR